VVRCAASHDERRRNLSYNSRAPELVLWVGVRKPCWQALADAYLIHPTSHMRPCPTAKNPRHEIVYRDRTTTTSSPARPRGRRKRDATTDHDTDPSDVTAVFPDKYNAPAWLWMHGGSPRRRAAYGYVVPDSSEGVTRHEARICSTWARPLAGPTRPVSVGPWVLDWAPGWASGDDAWKWVCVHVCINKAEGLPG